jgi:formate hydrogenlyase subunit 6/NADH:ubiquinone oxidoreductase subunit I
MSYLGGILDGLVSTFTGLRTTARFATDNWTGNGRVTVQYPEEKPTLAPRFRGHLFNKIDACVVCNGCAKACPVDCFTIVGERTESGKMRASRFDIDLTKCISCGLCVRACGTDSLQFTLDYTTAPEHHAGEAAQRWLFRCRPDQVPTVFDTADMARLTAIGGKSREHLSADDRAFLDRFEDAELGTVLYARFGMGMYTPEEKARVEAAREAEKKRKAEIAAKAEAERKAAKEAAEARAKAEAAADQRHVPPAADAAKPAGGPA